MLENTIDSKRDMPISLYISVLVSGSKKETLW